MEVRSLRERRTFGRGLCGLADLPLQQERGRLETGTVRAVSRSGTLRHPLHGEGERLWDQRVPGKPSPDVASEPTREDSGTQPSER